MKKIGVLHALDELKSNDKYSIPLCGQTNGKGGTVLSARPIEEFKKAFIQCVKCKKIIERNNKKN